MPNSDHEPDDVTIDTLQRTLTIRERALADLQEEVAELRVANQQHRDTLGRLVARLHRSDAELTAAFRVALCPSAPIGVRLVYLAFQVVVRTRGFRRSVAPHTTISQTVGLKEKAVGRHLQELRLRGLVHGTRVVRDGTTPYVYDVDNPLLHDLVTFLTAYGVDTAAPWHPTRHDDLLLETQAEGEEEEEVDEEE